jgi:hypothetical protein
MNRLLRLGMLLRLGVGLPIVSLTLTGCFLSSSSSDDTPSVPPPPTIMVASVSGGYQPMDGTWIRCVPGGAGPDEEEIVTVASTSVTVTTTTFTSGSSCLTRAGIPVVSHAIGASAGPKAATWWDGTGTPPTAPPAGLAVSYTPTMIYFGTTKAIILIDDTMIPWVFWSACGNGGCTVDGAGYPNYLEPTPSYRHIKESALP